MALPIDRRGLGLIYELLALPQSMGCLVAELGLGARVGRLRPTLQEVARPQAGAAWRHYERMSPDELLVVALQVHGLVRDDRFASVLRTWGRGRRLSEWLLHVAENVVAAWQRDAAEWQKSRFYVSRDAFAAVFDAHGHGSSADQFRDDGQLAEMHCHMWGAVPLSRLWAEWMLGSWSTHGYDRDPVEARVNDEKVSLSRGRPVGRAADRWAFRQFVEVAREAFWFLFAIAFDRETDIGRMPHRGNRRWLHSPRSGRIVVRYSGHSGLEASEENLWIARNGARVMAGLFDLDLPGGAGSRFGVTRPLAWDRHWFQVFSEVEARILRPPRVQPRKAPGWQQDDRVAPIIKKSALLYSVAKSCAWRSLVLQRTKGGLPAFSRAYSGFTSFRRSRNPWGRRHVGTRMLKHALDHHFEGGTRFFEWRLNFPRGGLETVHQLNSVAEALRCFREERGDKVALRLLVHAVKPGGPELFAYDPAVTGFSSGLASMRAGLGIDPRGHVRRHALELAKRYRELLRPRREYARFAHLLGGWDVAGVERHSSVFDYAAAIAHVRTERAGSRRPRSHQLTFHAGEDFYAITDGLRRIDSYLAMLEKWGTKWFPGEDGKKPVHLRIGHALAAGLRLYHGQSQDRIVPPQVEALDVAWDELLCDRQRGVWPGGAPINMPVRDGVHRPYPYEGILDYRRLRVLRTYFEADSHSEQDVWQRWGQHVGSLAQTAHPEQLAPYPPVRPRGGEPWPWKQGVARRFAVADWLHGDASGEMSRVWLRQLYVLHRMACIHRRCVDPARRWRRLVVESNPTSNFIVLGLDSFSQLPMYSFVLLGIPAVVCSDDPGVLDTTLSEELGRVWESWEAGIEDAREFFSRVVARLARVVSPVGLVKWTALHSLPVATGLSTEVRNEGDALRFLQGFRERLHRRADALCRYKYQAFSELTQAGRNLFEGRPIDHPRSGNEARDPAFPLPGWFDGSP